MPTPQRHILDDAINGMNASQLARKYNRGASTIKASLLTALRLVLTKPIHDDVSIVRGYISLIVKKRLVDTKLNTIPISVIEEHAHGIKSLIQTFDHVAKAPHILDDVAFLDLSPTLISKLNRSNIAMIAELKPFILYYLFHVKEYKEFCENRPLIKRDATVILSQRLCDLNLMEGVIDLEIKANIYTPLYQDGEHKRRLSDSFRAEDKIRCRREDDMRA